MWPLIGHFLIGIGSSAAILGVFKIIQLSFKEARFTRMLSSAVTIGLIGAIYGGELVNLFKMSYGFENVVMLLIGIGVILSALSAIFLPNVYAEKPEYSVKKGLKAIMFNLSILLICLSMGVYFLGLGRRYQQ
jgi:hypothetical protein